MARFNAAVMDGAMDAKFQNRYNYLLELLDTAYIVEKRIDNVLRKVTINPDDLISITVGNNKVFGIDEAGRVFATSLSNVDSPGYYMTYGYQTNPGLECYGPGSTGGTVKFFNLSLLVDDGFAVFDSHNNRRMQFGIDGSISLYDAGSRQVVNIDVSSNYAQLRLPSATNNAIGVDATGAYYTNGSATKMYMSGLVKKSEVLYSVLSKSSDQTFATSTSSAVVEFDTETGDCSLSSYGCKIPTGKYIAIVTAWIWWDANATGLRFVKIRKNSTDISMQNMNATSSGIALIQASASFAVTTGDIIYAYAYQSSGGDLNMDLSSRMFVTLIPID